MSLKQTYPPALVNKDTVYFPALLESRTKKPPSLFCEKPQHDRMVKVCFNQVEDENQLCILL